MNDRASIVILGIGARTPLGQTAAASAAAVRAGVSVIQDHPFMIDQFGEPMKVTRDHWLRTDLLGSQRAVELAVGPALDALAPLNGTRFHEPISLLIATGEDRPGQSSGHGEAVYAGVEAALAHHGYMLVGDFMAGGHSGGIVAMSLARDMLAQGRTRLCLVGGIDSWLEPETLEWLDDAEQLHSNGNRYGFCPGEAAAFCLLATRSTAIELGCRPLLDLRAVATAREDKCIKTDTVCLGEALAATFQSLFEQESANEPRIDRIVCDMNGERYRANEYGFAVLRSRRRFRDAADFEAPADCWGDVGAASGPLFVALVNEAYSRGYSRGPLSMIWASSEGGGRAAALLSETRKGA